MEQEMRAFGPSAGLDKAELEPRPRWLASLLSGAPNTMVPATCLRRQFELPPDFSRAFLHITALGLYDCEINGQPAGDHQLAPGWTDYHQRLYYQTYDVTGLLRPGANAVGVILGDGWYCGHVGGWERQKYGQRPQLLLRLEVLSGDGTPLYLVSDSSWKAAVGPVLENDLIMGEAYDARQELGAWTESGYDDRVWVPASLAEAPSIIIEKSPGTPVRRQEVLQPVAGAGALEARPLSRGVGCLVDFGQNFSGRVRLTAEGPRGACLTIRHGEMLDADGRLYTANLRTARATDSYTLKGGGPESWEPRFTFHGFRYAEITWRGGLDTDLRLLKVEGIVLHSEMARAGAFNCSSDLLNRLESNILWGQKSNFIDVPTDCPQRDERLGWTGDAQVFARTAAQRMDVRGFFRKWLQDMRDAQFSDGAIPAIVPANPDWRSEGGPAWADAVFIVPWVLYEEYGEIAFLADHYDCMRRYLDYLGAHKVKDAIREHPDIDGWHGYGDWLALDGSGRLDGGTPKDLIGTAFYARAADIMSETARLLKREREAEDYRRLRREIAQAFARRFVTDDGLLASGTQTAYVLALHFGLLPEELRPAAAAELVRLIRQNGNRLATGFVGASYLLPVLEEQGYIDVAYELLEQRECPSWLFPVINGATTIWERWDSWTPDKGFQSETMNSFNHYAYGAVGQWLFSSVAGLSFAAPGYARVLFKPRPGGTLTAAAARRRLPGGEAAIDWRLEDDRLYLHLTVPAGVTAELSLPAGWEAPPVSLEPGSHQLTAVRL